MVINTVTKLFRNSVIEINNLWRIYKKKKAFTLAEVLITLGVIGIVAALTMPNMIKKHRNKVLENQFKAAYSIIQQASYKMYMENEGDFIDFLGNGTGIGYISPYLDKYINLAPKYYKVIKNLNKAETKDLKMYTSNRNEFTYNKSFYHILQ